MTSEASTFIISLSMLRIFAIEIPSLKGHNSARRMLEEPMSLEKPQTQEPFESLRNPPPPARPEDGRTDASVFSLCHPYSVLTKLQSAEFLRMRTRTLNEKTKFSSLCYTSFYITRVLLLSTKSHRISV
ncbi:hypothetical protein ACB098_02G147700 [Castanea mollissima]